MLTKLSKFKRHGGFTGDIIVREDCSVLYIAVPKVANSSLKSAFLAPHVGRLPPEMQSELGDSERRFSPLTNPRLRDYFAKSGALVHRNEVIERYAGFQRIAFVRDPFERLVSCWRDKIRPSDQNGRSFEGGVHRGFLRFGKRFWGGMPLSEFVMAVSTIPDEDANPHFKSQTSFLRDDHGRWLPTWLGSMEALGNNVEQLNAAFPDLALAIEQKNATGKVDAASHTLDDFCRRQILTRYAEDVALIDTLRRHENSDLHNENAMTS